MEIIKHFEMYIDAQKATALRVGIFGLLLLGAALLLQISQLNPITQGLRNGFFVLSILLLVSAVGFNWNQNKLLKTKMQTYQSDPLAFEHQEVERMQKVNSSVPNVILGLCSALILLILALMFFVHQDFWRGVVFSVLIYFLGLIILESISSLSVKTYLETITN